MKNDLIDGSGFELGLPTREEMLKHQCTLLCAELETTHRDLRKAHQNIAKLIVMHRNCSTELAALTRPPSDHDRQWTANRRQSAASCKSASLDQGGQPPP